MAVPEGHFQLYTRIPPDLEAGEWRIRADHELEDDDGSVGSVERSNVHITINSPRYALPPGQVLSTFPPANSIGSYGSRLPQVVLKRRTLPWERLVDDDRPDTPWMALVLIAEGEAELRTGVPAAECFTDGVDLPRGDTLADPEVGSANCLVIRKSMVDRIFPTQQEVDLLAHAREVDLADTELALGDDDGFLSVVVGNRLPVPGVDDQGDETPITYLAALVNLEGQYDRLLPQSPDPVFVTPLVFVEYAQIATSTSSDHAVMNTADPSVRVAADLGRTVAVDERIAGGPLMSTLGGSVARSVEVTAAARDANTAHSGGSGWAQLESVEASAQIYADMAAGFATTYTPDIDDSLLVPLDQELRFPVLLHWSFTTSGQTTFRSLMEGLDSRLMGDTSSTQPVPDGRLPLEVTETGHTGHVHRTRDGDEVRAWYRGPLAPHPMDNAAARRIPLAHSSDQLRVVTPDGREDLSLASAFEIGRLLALSQPAIVASLLRWRREDFRAARLAAVRDAASDAFEALGLLATLRDLDVLADDRWGTVVGRHLVGEVVGHPDGFLGRPRPLLTPGRPLDVDGVPSDVLAAGLGLDAGVLRGRPDVVFERLRGAELPVTDLVLDEIGLDAVRDRLQTPLEVGLRDLGTDVLADGLVFDAATGPAFGAVGVPDLVGIELGEHLNAVIRGEFSAIDAIEGGTIGEIALGGLGRPIAGTDVDPGGVEASGLTLGRVERGGVPLARPSPGDDDPEGDDR